MTTQSSRSPVIAGLGITELGKVYGRSAADFAADAVRRAAADAGLSLRDIDGLLTSTGLSGGVGIGLQSDLDLRDLNLLSEMQGYGSTAGGMVAVASMAVQAGMADAIACVWADAPLKQDRSAGSAYAGNGAAPSGWHGLGATAGIRGPNSLYALAARRHMEAYGTTQEQFGAIAVAQRRSAMLNPLAQLRDEMTMDDYRASRWIVEPFRLFDCCLVSNGGIAVIVTSAQRAASLRQPAVHVLGWGQSHPGRAMRHSDDFGLVTGAARSGPRALAMAGVAVSDIDVLELYDCYTYTVLVSLEDYGFCAKGEGGPFVEEALGPTGTLNLNTGGGQLSAYYMWGMTPLSEAVIQARGQAGERQVADHELVLVSGNGGVLEHHSTLVLSDRSR